MKLKTDRVGRHRTARQACPLHRILSLSDPLLRRAPLIVEGYHPLGRTEQVCHQEANTRVEFARVKDGQGNYLWREAFLQGQPATLLGFPVAIDENMPNIAANALPVAFGGVVTLSSAGATSCPSADVGLGHRPHCATPRTLRRGRGGECEQRRDDEER